MIQCIVNMLAYGGAWWCMVVHGGVWWCMGRCVRGERVGVCVCTWYSYARMCFYVCRCVTAITCVSVSVCMCVYLCVSICTFDQYLLIGTHRAEGLGGEGGCGGWERDEYASQRIHIYRVGVCMCRSVCVCVYVGVCM